MDEKDKIKSFWLGRVRSNRYLWDESLSKQKALLIKRFIRPGQIILDLGAGDGRLAEFLSKSNDVTAVDFIDAGLTRLASPTLHPIICDLIDFVPTATYDLVVLFGIAIYLDRQSMCGVYSRCFDYLATGGTLLIHQQFGLDDDVVVDEFSQCLGSHYRAEYRSVKTESELLRSAGFTKITAEDTGHDRWPNTKFKLLIVKK